MSYGGPPAHLHSASSLDHHPRSRKTARQQVSRLTPPDAGGPAATCMCTVWSSRPAGSSNVARPDVGKGWQKQSHNGVVSLTHGCRCVQPAQLLGMSYVTAPAPLVPFSCYTYGDRPHPHIHTSSSSAHTSVQTTHIKPFPPPLPLLPPCCDVAHR
jgi:hypothetical protein